MAAGLELAPGRLREVRELFNETARQALLDADLRPVQRIDTWVDMEHINDRLWNEMQQMAPFGAEHPSPVLALARVEVMGKPRVVGNGHLRMTVRNERGRLSGIGFGMGDRELPAGCTGITFVEYLRCKCRYRISGHQMLRSVREPSACCRAVHVKSASMMAGKFTEKCLRFSNIAGIPY
jgi:hypothetical protein